MLLVMGCLDQVRVRLFKLRSDASLRNPHTEWVHHVHIIYTLINDKYAYALT